MIFSKYNMNFFQKARFLQVIIIILFLVFSFWWLISKFVYHQAGEDMIWGNSYQLIALVGAIGGFIVAKNFFYGIKSLNLVRRSILLFAVGLLLQMFGQTVFGFYIVFMKIHIPYPSIADIGFLGSIICYIFALLFLARVTGIKINIKSFKKRPDSLLIPAILLTVSYIIFLRHYQFDWSHPVTVFLDFAYPFMEAISVSLALSILLFSRKIVGEIIKWPPLLLAMLMQYIADFNFSIQFEKGTWVNSGYGDVLYMCAYFILSIALVQIGITFQKSIDNNREYVKSLLA
jgi:hypothetical protein